QVASRLNLSDRGAHAAEQPRQERSFLESLQRFCGQHRRVSRKPAHARQSADVPPEDPFLVARLLFEYPARGPFPVTARHALPDRWRRVVRDLEAEPPESERQVHVLEVRAEVFGEAAGPHERFATIERGAGRGAEDGTGLRNGRPDRTMPAFPREAAWVVLV